ncbi:serine hydrolase domain-containing protein [Streptomyces sp. NPDC090022]|uniref:serine hydrolase domain-containing protein n=1 Tax=Streptomyces sp. NPDC090022 TaxID=3365920 RepID=UPI0038023D84
MLTRLLPAGTRTALTAAAAALTALAVAAPTASASSASAPTASASSASATTPRPDHAAAQRVLDRAVADGGVPGIVAELRDGRDRWTGTAGVADTTTGRERHPRDRFRIGSTTKTFTATVLLQLVAEHRLTLDDPVRTWIPEAPADVTVRQLLGHTSGIPDYVTDPVIVSRSVGLPFLEHRFDSYRPQDLVAIALSRPPVFAPGTRWAYSNTNYVLAGMIVERVTGGPLADAIAQRITRPLGLTATYLPRGDDPRIHGPHGRHYSKLMLTAPDAGVHDVTELNPSWGWAAGGIVSTTGDLDRFFGALLGGRLLPPAQQEEMFTMLPTENWIPGTTYGLGVSSVRLACGETVWGMGGAVNGSWTFTYGTRDGRRVLSVNVNGDWNDPIATFTDLLGTEFCPTA